MDYRYLISKTFNSCSATKTSLVDGIPVYSSLIAKYGEVDDEDFSVAVNKDTKPDQFSSEVIRTAKGLFEGDPLLSAITISADGSKVIPLTQQFDFKVGKSYNNYALNKKLMLEFEEGITLWDLLNSDEYTEFLDGAVTAMFPEEKLTGKSYSKYIPLTVIAGVIPAQVSAENKSYFNPDGVVSVAEFLDMLNAINNGSNANTRRATSLDSVSVESDYFNEGYNMCLNGLSSPFYKLYSREELKKPLTRIELAYLTVICWTEFSKFGHIYGGKYPFGLNIDWSCPSVYLDKFVDGYSYRIYNKCLRGTKVVSLDLHDYIGSMTMPEFKASIKSGSKPIPLIMIMSLLELDAIDLFYFEKEMLNPLAEVSRGEICYFTTKLAKEFSKKFVSKGDNSYN